jgi:hypothetical protein
VERVLGGKPLSDDHQELFQRIWKWLVVKGVTTKENPQVVSDADNYHIDGLIGINENHRDASFPLGAVMLEETLHYVLTSDDPHTSADYSPEFLHGILRIIAGQLAGAQKVAKREFQSMLIRYLWGLIESDSC